MPLPLILVGAAVLAGAYGVKKTFDAKSDFDDAEAINEDARVIYENAQRSLEERRNKTQEAVESLGRQKMLLYRDALSPFVESYSKIKNVDYEEGDILDGKLPDVSIDEVREVREVVLRMDGVDALSGMAAGGAAAVLGGIVAAPVLLVGGLMMASKAEEAKESALSNRRKARAAATAMEEAEVAARDIGRMATQVRNVLKRLQDYLCSDLEALEDLVSGSTDYRAYDSQERELVCRTASLAVTAKNLAESTLLDENGSVTSAIRQELKEAKRSVKALGTGAAVT